MPNLAEIIAGNLARLHDRISAAADQADRSSDSVRLVAVTKYVGRDEAAALLAAGCNDLGESRPQELWAKADAPALVGAQWHLVGHLQRNKVRRTLPIAALIHSVDSERLLAALQAEAKRTLEATRTPEATRTLGASGSLERAGPLAPPPVDVLLEINCSGESAKHGLSPDAAVELVPRLTEWPHVRARGLMTMASRVGGRGAARQAFAALRKLRDRLQPRCPTGTMLDELSMGMSGDFEEAIREGATIIRVGTVLFEGIHDPTH